MCLIHKMRGIKGGEWDPKFRISLPLNLNCMLKSNFLNDQKYHTHTPLSSYCFVSSKYLHRPRKGFFSAPSSSCM